MLRSFLVFNYLRTASTRRTHHGHIIRGNINPISIAPNNEPICHYSAIRVSGGTGRPVIAGVLAGVGFGIAAYEASKNNGTTTPVTTPASP
jgi:hypothetical protein